MDNKISCAIAKDLLPNYIEKLTSEETNRAMEEHLRNCTDCTMERDAMMRYVETDKAPEILKMKNYLKKTKTMYLLKGIFLALGVIGIIVTFIVDIAINRRLTWSLIVDAGAIYLYVCALSAIISMKHKAVKTLATASILVLPLLFIIESVINRNYVSEPLSWFREVALPISLIWIAVLWATVIIRHFMKTNLWNTIGMLILLVILGSAFTNSIARQVSIKEIYLTGLEWIDSVVYLACAVACFGIGYIRKRR